MSHNPAIAMGALRRQGVDCALKAVKRMVLPCNDYIERLVIIVFTNFAFSHIRTSQAASVVAVVN
jgi:hypothetical protein